jgi:hypothetical protein
MLCNLKELMAKKSKTLSAPIELPALTTDNMLERAEIAQANAEVDSTPTEVDSLYVPIVKPMKKVKTVKTGVGYEILTLIAQGELSNKEIVEMVLAANPLRKTTYACVAWYKSQVAAGKIDLPVITPTEETGNEEEYNEEGNLTEV